MSEIINNREQHTINNPERLEILRNIFKELHNGRNIHEVKAHFDAYIGKITIEEISQLSNDFLEDEGISIVEVHDLYANHLEIFKDSIEVEQTSQHPEEQPGHPIHTFILENK